MLTPSLIIHAPLNGREKRRQSERATKLSLFFPSLVEKGPLGEEKRAFYCVWLPTPLQFTQFTSSQSFGAWSILASLVPTSSKRSLHKNSAVYRTSFSKPFYGGGSRIKLVCRVPFLERSGLPSQRSYPREGGDWEGDRTQGKKSGKALLPPPPFFCPKSLDFREKGEG